MSQKTIYVTQPHLPPLEEFFPYLEKIWDNKILTNNGPMHQALEKALAEYLQVNHVALFNNGTNALFTALQALELSGEVITTPFSFVATTHSIVWNKLKPVFVDIDPTTLNLDPSKIEAAINEHTSAIMPVHCYGNPCDTDAINALAEKYNLKVLYDAAHAFAVKDDGGSVLRHGDLSVLSFHATKVFNTFEGGAIICHTDCMKKKIDQLKNFGIINELEVNCVGSNGKMSEINAAFGLLQLKHIDTAINLRKKVDSHYREKLLRVKGIELPSVTQTASNYSYFPILVSPDYPLTRDELYQKLKENNIIARKYFYPLISEFSVYKNDIKLNAANIPAAKYRAEQVLCLPIYPDLSVDDQDIIISIISKV